MQVKEQLYTEILNAPESPEIKSLIDKGTQKIQDAKGQRQNWLDSRNFVGFEKKRVNNSGAIEHLQSQGFDFGSKDNTSGEVWDAKQYHLVNAVSSNTTSDAAYLIHNYRDRILPVEKEFIKYASNVNFGGTIGAFIADPKKCNEMYIPIIGGKVEEQDPYGTQSSDSVIAVEKEGKLVYLGSRHPGYDTILIRLTDFCNKGCAYCYFGKETREKAPNIISDTNQSMELNNPVNQIQLLGEYLRNNPESQTSDILLSGGEPMDLSTKTWEDILKEIATWSWLKTFRICTGSLFLGSPQSISSDLIKLIADYQESTGNRICFNCNVAHPEQMLRLESIVKYFEMQKEIKGLTIYPQIPVTSNNFDIFDLEKSYNKMLEMCNITSSVYDGQVYKFICDMQGSLPKILFIQVAARFDQHQGFSNIQKPIACEIFTDSGNSSNLAVNHNTLANIKLNGGLKIISNSKDSYIIQYKITHANGTIFTFQDTLPNSIKINL
jgi:hypothetical protein